MKTKFIGTPTGPPGKQTRRNLRRYSQASLKTFLAWLENHSKVNYGLNYTLPFNNVRGSFNVLIGRRETLQFLISPGEQPGRYIADKVVFVYHGDRGESVSLEVREERVNNLFDYYERTGAVRVELEKAQRAN